MVDLGIIGVVETRYLLLVLFFISALLLAILTKIKKIQPIEEKKDSNIQIQEIKAEIIKFDEIPERINIIAKEFFKFKMKNDNEVDYDEIIKEPSIQNRPEILRFCKNISEVLYSGRKSDISFVSNLITNLEAIIVKEKSLSNIEDQAKINEIEIKLNRLRRNIRNSTISLKVNEVEMLESDNTPNEYEIEQLESRNIESIDGKDRIKSKISKIRSQNN